MAKKRKKSDSLGSAKKNHQNTKGGSQSKDNKKSLNNKNKQKSSKGKKRRSVNKQKNTMITKLMDVMFFLIIVAMLGGSFLFMISQKEDKTVAGYRFYDVLTNSMVKTKSGQKGNFAAGDMIIVKSTKSEDVKVGDIITFVPNKEAKDTFLTHRVIKKIEPKGDEKVPHFVTQGDSNNSPDPEISGNNIIGKKVFSIPKAGSIVKLIRENILLSIVFIVALFLLVFIIKGYFEESEVSKKSKKVSKKSRRKSNEKSKKK
ncbi:signal peptidase I [Vagococcus sp.]|uniref:signal peptidase I n=1 Tax=Vagococcus sp. TaxID=1933889 RepID=UPI002FC69955